MTKVAQRAPDVVLLDVKMDDLSGYEVCRRIKTLPDTADTQVLFVTARTEEEDLLKAKEFNAKRYYFQGIGRYSPDAAMARGLGHAEDAAALAERATSYRSLWDPAQRFLVGRRRDGTFATSTGPTAWQSFYAEGGVWQYLWYAPHDLAGLAAVMGGSDAMLARLDEMFELTVNAPRTPLPDRYYWQGNEPDIHAPWIPSRFDDAARASRFVDWVRRERYGDGPDGIPGNDDAGTMSAWYVFAALGVFPIAGTDTWLLAAPSVTDATVTLPGGASLHVSAPEAGTGALRPSMIRWADAPLAHPTLTHEVLARGGHLTFDLVR